MSAHFSCPNCGADVVFRSAAMPSRICDQCRSMLVRSDDGVAVVGVSAALPFDVSPIRIGMRGTIDGYGFEVVGRIRWGWTDGSWNEWMLLFDEGTSAWLGDAMGQFMVLHERPFEQVRTKTLRAIAEGAEAIAGTEVQIDNAKWTIGDAREVVCLAAEGELGFALRPGWRAYSVDLRATNGACATLQREAGGTSFCEGRYVTLEELHPSGLRAFDGWPLPAYAA